MAASRQIKVFIASPGDLVEERQAFKQVVDELNGDFGDGSDTDFVPLGWEDTLLPANARAQDEINKDVISSDIFILVLYRRWGQPAKGSKWSSYTEEEFELALASYAASNPPKRPIVYVFLKKIPAEFLADPGDQLKLVLAFREKLKDRSIVGRGFDDLESFKKLLSTHLRETAKKGLLAAPPKAPSVLTKEDLSPILKELAATKRELQKLKRAAKKKRGKPNRGQPAKMSASAAKAEIHATEAKLSALELAEAAAEDALAGRIDAARRAFAEATVATTDLRVLYLGYEFFERTGDLNEAERLLNRWLAISGREQPTSSTAAALGNLGLIAHSRGNLDEAEKLHREALEIYRKLGRLDGQASELGNLGLIAQDRGNLDEAEKLHRESLEIFRKLGRPEGQASELGNLGLIAKTRSNLDEAEKLLRESLEIYRKLGNLEGQASQLGNLGLIAQTRGNLDEAEKLLRESLEIDRKLGRLEGQANQVANLGSIAEQRGDMAEARRLWTESRDLYLRIGIPNKVKQMQGWLDGLPLE